ncbi:MAG: VTT domain-containing protein [Candidatus Saccharibacteria bacterium]|nr:VTT domain-containing protein [Candidatus Saccharibacteria bacterium]
MFNVDTIISSGGILIISAIIFAESGLLIGFFLPGDTLLFGAGLAASQGKFSLLWLIVCVVLAAIIGDNVGYSIGRRAGPRIFKKEDGILFRQEYLQKSEEFYEKHGGKTIILARFTPIVRTFAPVVAGAGKMTRKKFMVYNIIGGILWGGGMSLLGFTIGGKIPHLDKYIEVVIFGVMAVSLLLAFGHILKDKKTRTLLVASIISGLRKISLNKKID